ncbi:MAG: GNAT family N-acetyltransferase [Thermoprotei archaeon]
MADGLKLGKENQSGCAELMEAVLRFAEKLRSSGSRGLLLTMGEESMEEKVILRLADYYGGLIRIVSPTEARQDKSSLSWVSLDKGLGKGGLLVAVSCRTALDANSVGAASGMVMSGGLMVLYAGRRRGEIPSSESLRAGPPSSFVKYVLHSAARCGASMGVDFGGDGNACKVLWQNQEMVYGKPREGREPTEEQRAVISHFEEMAISKGKFALVITGGRGTGKSSVLGMGAARFLASHGCLSKIYLVSRDFGSVRSGFEFFCEASGASWTDRMAIACDRNGGPIGELRWLPMEAVLRIPAELPDLVMVDEAAEFPVEQLLALTRRFKKVVFSTTVHGYEGSGKGFQKRFFSTLSREGRHEVHHLSLETPIRYIAGDPLERWASETLLMDAKLSSLSAFATSSGEPCQGCSFEQISHDMVAISEFYPLLAEAHYRNEPNDLAALVDLLDHRLYGLKLSGQPAGFVQLSPEGPLSKAEVAIVLAGGELSGNMVPDKLVSRAGMARLADLRGIRVVRIAVHPDLQGRGLGSRMLADVETMAAREGYGWVGASFSLDRPTLSFWLKNDYVPLYISWKRVSSGGSQSVIVLKPLSREVLEDIKTSSERILGQWAAGSSSIYRELEPGLLAACSLSLGSYASPKTFKVPPLGLPLESDIYDLVQAAIAYASCPRAEVASAEKQRRLEALFSFLQKGDASRTDRRLVLGLLEELKSC